MKLYEAMAQAVSARLNCENSGNTEWLDKWTAKLRELSDRLPSGSGFDSGTKIDLDVSHADKLVFHTSYHHMNDTGYYTGWTSHMVTVTPSFIGGFNVRVSGRDLNSIKDYIAETFHEALSEEVGNGGL